ncbi:uncharacterized protein LOC131310496 [Rhododendron vialii]|uniref:uncharacterized protein LOC131310496 n=1 Tax=Rhododendron vialii TaxID=182163 RepID=UPI00265DAB74|nr:uncharacterized protein LOC131310496 [Rhododendron vialii]
MDGARGAFLSHVGKDPNSLHKIAERSYGDLMNQSRHIQKVLDNFTSKQIANNRLWLKASIDTVRLFAHQGIAFRGRDESASSMNRGNFLETLNYGMSFSEKMVDLIKNAPKNATYTSPIIQKEILHVISTKVQKEIREEIGDAKFYLIVDEARDESMREQMAIVLRFVNKDGFVRERFLGVAHVPDTISITLKNEIYSILFHHSLNIQNIRGQGYDGVSNMRGGWNGLQALVSNDCPYAYYIHCFVHILQLALVAASKEVGVIHCFFAKLPKIVTIADASCKRFEELKLAQASDIEYLLSINELESGSGLNQLSTLQGHADTRWSSHLRSISSMIKLFSATCVVLLKVKVEGNSSQRGEAKWAYEEMTTFEFVFMLHLMKEIMLITDFLWQAL